MPNWKSKSGNSQEDEWKLWLSLYSFLWATKSRIHQEILIYCMLIRTGNFLFLHFMRFYITLNFPALIEDQCWSHVYFFYCCCDSLLAVFPDVWTWIDQVWFEWLCDNTIVKYTGSYLPFTARLWIQLL